MSDSRTGRRFPLNLPITIREGESADQTSGTTQNVSAAGVYIRADAELEVGSHIEFEITLPSEIIGSNHDAIEVNKTEKPRTGIKRIFE